MNDITLVLLKKTEDINSVGPVPALLRSQLHIPFQKKNRLLLAHPIQQVQRDKSTPMPPPLHCATVLVSGCCYVLSGDELIVAYSYINVLVHERWHVHGSCQSSQHVGLLCELDVCFSRIEVKFLATLHSEIYFRKVKYVLQPVKLMQ
jgi:hypothetical protein